MIEGWLWLMGMTVGLIISDLVVIATLIDLWYRFSHWRRGYELPYKIHWALLVFGYIYTALWFWFWVFQWTQETVTY